jgi:nucleoid-associated protein YgaU
VLALAIAPAWAETQTPGFETYVVRHGDTLSGIAGRVLGDPQRWREILKANPQVTNANRIYPGDTLQVPVPVAAAPPAAADGGLSAREGSGAGAGAGQDAAAAAAAAESAAAAPPAPVEPPAPAAAPEPPAAVAPAAPEKPPATIDQATYRSAGYLSNTLPALAIVALQDDRVAVSSGDVAIVNAPIAPGTRFTVVRATRRIFHPKTRADLGWHIRVLGTAEVSCRNEQTSIVTLRAMRDGASVGDYLVPYDPTDVLKEDRLPARMQPECTVGGPEDAMIVAVDEDRLAVGEMDYAYLDKGTAAGVAPGRRFIIYREIAPEGRTVVGELQVLRAGETTSSALITTSIREVHVGDRLRTR